MKTREMALLSAVSRTGSVTLAARELGMSQPAASTLLKAVEERLGFAAFSRERRRLVPTPNGRMLVAEIDNALAAQDAVQRLAASMRLGTSRRLVIGAVAAAGAALLPAAVRQLQSAYSDVKVVLKAGMSAEIVEMARAQRIDLGVVVGPVPDADVGYRPLGALALYAIVPPGDALAARDAPGFEEIAGLNYIAFSRQLQVGAVTARQFEAIGQEYHPSIEVTQFSAACAFVAAGCGVAVLDSLGAMHAKQHGLRALPMRCAVDLSLGLVWPLNPGLGKLAQALGGFLDNVHFDLPVLATA